MVVKIRLVKHGAKLDPIYHIVVANARTRLTARPLETLGSFKPAPNRLDRTKHIQLDFARAKYWIGVGAQPTRTVGNLFAKAGLLPLPPLFLRKPDFEPKSVNVVLTSEAGSESKDRSNDQTNPQA